MIVVKRAGSESWRFAEDLGQIPHAMLFVRDALRLDTGSGTGIPPRLAGEIPDRSSLLDSAVRAEAARQWAAWWRGVIGAEPSAHLGPGTVDPAGQRQVLENYRQIVDPTVRGTSLAGWSVLQPAAEALFTEGCRWADAARQPLLPPARMRPGMFDWHLVRDTAEAVAAEAGVGVIDGSVSLLLVEGTWWELAAPQLVLCSVAAVEDPQVARAILHRVFTSGLAA